jgi:hypothetical protein
MTIYVILAFCGIISYLAFKSTFFGLKLISGMSWIVLFIYIKNNPPAGIVEGDRVHTAILVVIIGFALMIVLSGLFRGIQKTERWENGEETSHGFKVPNWMSNVFKDEEKEKRVNSERKKSDYEDRMDRALGIGRYSGRRR